MKRILTTLLLFNGFFLMAQIHTDFIGAGHSEGITITSSSDFEEATASNTLNGNGMDANAMEASRFLAQSTLGFDNEMIDGLKEELDFEAWIDEQMQIQPSNISSMLNAIWEEVLQLHVDNGEDPEEVFGPYQLHFNYSWWQLNMTNEDLLRQRVAFALSEIFVISMNSDLTGHPESVASFYDILIDKAFGNYEELLSEISLHPSMGYYLSHLNNPKADPANNIHPDENYAREIMQLFSIGLYELNQDGTRKLDGLGNPIPTYDNNDIKELAKIFTGLGPGDINEMVTWTDEPYFGLTLYGADMTVPMKMYNDFHESEEKTLLDGTIVPANQDGMDDIQQTIEYLSNHENVGPLLALRLIQRLVKSNPSSDYISRVAGVFNNNGNGVRGDLGAMVKAILLDPEARSCTGLLDQHNGRLREPVVKLIQYAKSFELDSPQDRYWHNGYSLMEGEKQNPMTSPTVFNFFQYDHAPVGEISNQGLFGPEFKIHDTGTSINYINGVYSRNLWDNLWWSWHGNYGAMNPSIITDDLEAMSEDTEVLLNHLDIVFTHGQLSDRTRRFIRDAIEPNTWDPVEKVRTALYLLLISPDYTIIK